MTDVRLNPATGDIDLTPQLNGTNDVTLIRGADAVEQHWRIRMKHFRGEWFLDRRTGIPYYEHVLVKNPNLAVITTIFRQATRETPGIAEVTQFSLALDTPTRTLTIEVEGKLEGDLGTFEFVYEELIVQLPQEDQP